MRVARVELPQRVTTKLQPRVSASDGDGGGSSGGGRDGVGGLVMQMADENCNVNGDVRDTWMTEAS